MQWGKIILPTALALFIIACPKNLWGLVPLESLILGDLSSQYNESKQDPLELLFSLKNKSPALFYKEQLALYRGHLEAGHTLKEACPYMPKANYATLWDKDQAMRSMMATVQYIGLDVTVRAIGRYAKKLGLTDQEYSRMTDSLVTNYCSPNISVIGQRALRQNFLIKFNKENSYTLPTTQNNPLYPKSILKLETDKALEQELSYTLKLFRSFCSWGGQVEAPRLLVPLLSDPWAYHFFLREMSGVELQWAAATNTLNLAKKKNPTRVLCQGLICRKNKNNDDFEKKLPRALGANDLYDDFSRLYCHEFRHLKYDDKNKRTPEVLLQIMKSQTLDDERLMLGQWQALMTGQPDFFVRSEKYNQALEILRQDFMRSWNEWAFDSVKIRSQDLYYEESLTLEIINRDFYFNPNRPAFALVMDVNWGEMDRSVQKLGKLSASYSLKISKKLMSWGRERYRTIGLHEVDDQENIKSEIIHRLSKEMEHQIDQMKKQFKIIPWAGDLPKLIATEIFAQVLLYQGDYFDKENFGQVPINIELRYAPFALRYIKNEYEDNYKFSPPSLRNDD